MAEFWQTTGSAAFSWMKMFKFWWRFHWNTFIGGRIDNKPALVQIMAWHRTGHNPFSEPMMAWFTDAYMRHPATINLIASLIIRGFHRNVYPNRTYKTYLLIGDIAKLKINHDWWHRTRYIFTVWQYSRQDIYDKRVTVWMTTVFRSVWLKHCPSHNTEPIKASHEWPCSDQCHVTSLYSGASFTNRASSLGHG